MQISYDYNTDPYACFLNMKLILKNFNIYKFLLKYAVITIIHEAIKTEVET